MARTCTRCDLKRIYKIFADKQAKDAMKKVAPVEQKPAEEVKEHIDIKEVLGKKSVRKIKKETVAKADEVMEEEKTEITEEIKSEAIEQTELSEEI